MYFSVETINTLRILVVKPFEKQKLMGHYNEMEL
jgi:hypothetical protein